MVVVISQSPAFRAGSSAAEAAADDMMKMTTAAVMRPMAYSLWQIEIDYHTCGSRTYRLHGAEYETIYGPMANHSIRQYVGATVINAVNAVAILTIRLEATWKHIELAPKL